MNGEEVSPGTTENVISSLLKSLSLSLWSRTPALEKDECNSKLVSSIELGMFRLSTAFRRQKIEFSIPIQVTIINGSKLRATNARRSAPGDQIAMTKKKSEKPPRKRRSPAHRKIEKHFDQDLFTMLTRRRINIRLLSVWDNKRDNDRSI